MTANIFSELFISALILDTPSEPFPWILGRLNISPG
jgi:hypothetical protein